MEMHPAPIGASATVLWLATAREKRPARPSSATVSAQVLAFPLHIKQAKCRRRIDRLIDEAISQKKTGKREPLGAAEFAMIYEQLPEESRATVSAAVNEARVTAEVKERRERWSDDEWYANMGQNIKKARLKLGVSEKEAARVAGRSVETWRNYERTGKGRLTFAVLAFAEHFGISLDDMIRDPDC